MLPPQIPDSEWLESVSPTTLREGKALAPAATDVVWDAPFFRGAVADGGSLFRVALDLRSRTFPRAECSCETGRSRRVCRHALAVYFAYFAPLLAAAEAARRAAEKPLEKEAREPRPPSAGAAKSAFPRPPSAEHFSAGKTFAGKTFAGKTFAGKTSAESASPAQKNFRAEIDGGSAWLSVVLPPPEAPFRAALRDLLKNSGFALDARSRRWFLRGEHETLNFLAAHRDFLEKDCRAAFSPAFRNFLRGLRTAENVRAALEAGAARVVVGTKAAQDDAFVAELVETFGGEKIAVGIDAKDGFVAVRGWVDVTARRATELAGTVAALGVKTVVYTDIATDGMLSGPNFAALEKMLESTGAGVIASGGVSRREDVLRLRELAGTHANLDGVIVGKALYEKRVSLPDLLAIAAS